MGEVGTGEAGTGVETEVTGRAVLTGTLTRLWVLVVAGIPAGVLVVGVGGRLAMLLLRLTSPDSVRGLESDDGFTIGQVTLFGTYNFLALGAAAGLLAAVGYTVVGPWLLGPRWLRLLTAAFGAGAVVGSTIIHDDGVDFRLLEPHWLAVALFVAIPAAIGGVIGIAVDAARRRAERPLTTSAIVAAVVLVACFPPSVFLLVPIVLVLLPWSWLCSQASLTEATTWPPTAIGVRALWVAIGLIGVSELVGDIQSVV
jgi:hypothetical protein